MGTVQDAADSEDHKKDLGRYVAVNFKEGGSLLQQAMENMVAHTFTPPTDPSDPTNVVQVKKWEREYDAFSNIVPRMSNGESKVMAIGRCVKHRKI
jgi:hypothetical protein